MSGFTIGECGSGWPNRTASAGGLARARSRRGHRRETSLNRCDFEWRSRAGKSQHARGVTRLQERPVPSPRAPLSRAPKDIAAGVRTSHTCSRPSSRSVEPARLADREQCAAVPVEDFWRPSDRTSRHGHRMARGTSCGRETVGNAPARPRPDSRSVVSNRRGSRHRAAGVPSPGALRGRPATDSRPRTRSPSGHAGTPCSPRPSAASRRSPSTRPCARGRATRTRTPSPPRPRHPRPR